MSPRRGVADGDGCQLRTTISTEQPVAPATSSRVIHPPNGDEAAERPSPTAKRSTGWSKPNNTELAAGDKISLRPSLFSHTTYIVIISSSLLIHGSLVFLTYVFVFKPVISLQPTSTLSSCLSRQHLAP
jgi:hypothetical protein